MTKLHVVIYLGMFSFFEFAQKNAWLSQFQLARTPAQEPTWAMKLKVLKEFGVSTAVNHFVGMPLAFMMMTKFGMPDHLAKLPSAVALFKHFSLSYMIAQNGFYFAHRLFHHGPLCTLMLISIVT
jgi:sterol desaturase/sphingolipid hydroxylase (fatty acid hydroxylase superfamily)